MHKIKCQSAFGRSAQCLIGRLGPSHQQVLANGARKGLNHLRQITDPACQIKAGKLCHVSPVEQHATVGWRI